ncbi:MULTISPECIES: fimbrial protein [Serratia]|uniref:fimbrial protein n=1 Tax=Serratia TaxID=613 RepID=UPI00041C5775|nr:MULTISPECIES: fimbrial protein [Serratia]UAN62219.1 fimbrial protein [Serratia sp. JSRIV006]
MISFFRLLSFFSLLVMSGFSYAIQCSWNGGSYNTIPNRYTFNLSVNVNSPQSYNTGGNNLLNLSSFNNVISCKASSGNDALSLVGVGSMVGSVCSGNPANCGISGWVIGSSGSPVTVTGGLGMNVPVYTYNTSAQGIPLNFGLYMTQGKLLNIVSGQSLGQFNFGVSNSGGGISTFTINAIAGNSVSLNLNTCSVPTLTTVTLPTTGISLNAGAFGTPVQVNLPIDCSNVIGTLALKLSWAGGSNIIPNTASASPAGGVGIILTTNTNTQLTNGQTFSLKNTSSNNISFNARYYSAGAQATSGAVQGTVNIDIVYR